MIIERIFKAYRIWLNSDKYYEEMKQININLKDIKRYQLEIIKELRDLKMITERK